MIEEWRPFPGWGDLYEISSLGNYRSRGKATPNHAYADACGYRRAELWRNGKRTRLRIGRAVAQAFLPDFDPLLEVDHVNRDEADDRASNLRMATRCQNNSNRQLRAPNKVGARGVVECPSGYLARIRHEGAIIDLGSFRTVQEAAQAYDDAARRLHGAFAVTNS